MRKKLGVVCVVLGALLISGALGLLVYNQAKSYNAQRHSAESVAEIKKVIAENTQNPDYDDEISSESSSKASVEYQGCAYAGFIEVPSLSLELPVASSWSYDMLEVSPCIYSGSAETKNLVIIAHNYSSHFGKLQELSADDEVLFTDAKGKVSSFAVEAVDVVDPALAEEVTDGSFDLALVTCTYSGKTRFVVYCNEKNM